MLQIPRLDSDKPRKAPSGLQKMPTHTHATTRHVAAERINTSTRDEVLSSCPQILLEESEWEEEEEAEDEEGAV